MKKHVRKSGNHQTVPAGYQRADDEAVTTPQDQPSLADKETDQRMANELTWNAGNSVLSRHRNGLTAIENESDGVSEDEDELEAAVTKESEENGLESDEPETRE